MRSSKPNHYIKSKNKFDIEKILFDNSPNFQFKENIVTDFNNSYWICDSFDIYYPSKSDKNEPYLVYPSIQKIEIKILKISNKTLVKSITELSNFIEKIKIFYNSKDNNNYLLASDWDYNVHIWNLDENYKYMYKLVTGYSNYIYSFLIYFKYDYIITSTVGHTNNIDYIKIFSFKDGLLLKNIPNSNNNDTLYCLMWEKDENESYIVACCYEKIEIYNILSGDLYGELITEEQDSCGDYYFSAFISNNNKYLFASSYEGFINIWNLYEKNLIKSIKFGASFFKIIPWSIFKDYSEDKEESKFCKNYNNYIVVCDKTKNGIYIINFIFRKEIEGKDNIDTNKETFYKHEIISFLKNEGENPIKAVKKFIHPIYGESILTSGEEQNINLWINNQPIIIDIFKN